MSKSKTNTLDALRALIAERQQYDQWISTLESKRDGTVENVFNRVYSDYRSRLDRVVGEIRGHAEELQLNIAALTSRLGEVAKDEEAKRDTMSEAELRAAVGEYDAAQWESMQADSKRQLEKIAADRAALEAQLAELESIRKLSEVTAPSIEGSAPAASPQPEQAMSAPAAVPTEPSVKPSTGFVEPAGAEQPAARKPFSDAGWPARDIVEPVVPVRSEPTPAKPSARPADARPSAPSAAQPSVQPSADTSPAKTPQPSAPKSAQTFAANTDAAVAAPRPSAIPVAPPPAPAPPRKKRDTPTGRDAEISSGFSKPIRTPADSRPEVNKTLKCPECGTPNYPTEWYCERCGGELATM